MNNSKYCNTKEDSFIRGVSRLTHSPDVPYTVLELLIKEKSKILIDMVNGMQSEKLVCPRILCKFKANDSQLWLRDSKLSQCGFKICSYLKNWRMGVRCMDVIHYVFAYNASVLYKINWWLNFSRFRKKSNVVFEIVLACMVIKGENGELEDQLGHVQKIDHSRNTFRASPVKTELEMSASRNMISIEPLITLNPYVIQALPDRTFAASTVLRFSKSSKRIFW